jgi:hypothetical protein
MEYVEAPKNWMALPNQPSLFLAGGITGCPDWQMEVAEMLVLTNYVVLNPRRANFPIGDPLTAEYQIKWEHDYLRKASAILFWFPCETLCPIVLYELGAWSMTEKPIFIGVHPEYQRRQDVEIQTQLSRPAVKIVYSINDLVAQVI